MKKTGVHKLQGWLEQRFELARAGAASNLRPMEGMRGLAVFLVFLVHFISLTQPWRQGYPAVDAIAERVHAMGNVGVDLFFVLSGFLIYGALIAKPRPYAAFMARRVRRIYPAFLAVFALYLLAGVLQPSQSKLPTGQGQALLYLANNLLLLPGIFPLPAMITVAWSLSYEFFYYLTLPLLVNLFGLRQRSRRWRVNFFLGFALLLAIAFALWGGPVRLLMFIAGILLFEALGGGALGWLRQGQGALALLAGLAVAMLDAPGPLLQTLKFVALGSLFFMLCLAAFRDRDSALAYVLSWRPLRWLGNMSYAYYLMHGLVLNAAGLLLARLMPASQGGPWMMALLLPLLFALTLLPSALLFLLVERPLSLAPAARSHPLSSSVKTTASGVKKESS